MVWTVDDATRMQQLLDMGVDSITSNYPERLNNLVAAMGYARWASDPGQELSSYDRDFAADPEGDGNSNGIEHVLGVLPTVPQFHALTELDAPAPGVLVFHHTLSNMLGFDVAYGYEWSTDLQHWDPIGTPNSAGDSVAVEAVVVVDRLAPLPDDVRVTATITGESTPNLFVRLFARKE